MAIQLGRRSSRYRTVNATPDWLLQAQEVAQNTTDAKIVVDFSSVSTIASRELNELIRLQLLVKQEGRRLVLENAQDHLWQVFTETRLDRLFELRMH